jgi:tetratricopeptide (TPR) repeat protein
MALSSGSARGEEAGAATTDARAEARRLARTGQVYYESGQFERALDAYRAAYETAPAPGVLFNMGQCYRQLGEHERAIFFLQGYLRGSPEAPNRADVEALIVDEQAALERQAATAAADVAPDAPPDASEAAPPGDTAVTVEPAVVVEPAPSRPVYRRWWFWTVIGVVVAGATAGVLVGTLYDGEPALPQGSLGTFDTR